ncbi:MAG: 4Fe-4S dicluster domain-containing protein [Bacteroidetes bacterium]|nr:4Fe-4S dicluster domain-containing protein [Bacteroidota bacterium]
MLRTTRIIIAATFATLITLLFLDFTGTLHKYFHWLAHLQFIPALLAVNIGIVAGLLILTLVLGRWYCSVICPLGVFQDLVGRVAKLFSKKKKTRFSYSKPLPWLRWGFVVLIIGAFLLSINSIVSTLDPYAAYGRMAHNFLQPLYKYANNFLAYLAERAGSYAFYRVEIIMHVGSALVVAIVTFVVVGIMAWRSGRSYCNTVCPVGTVLGFFSRFSVFKIRIAPASCNKCGLCERTCKSSCIDSENKKIDHSRCVACMNCLGICNKQALTYSAPQKNTVSLAEENTDTNRRSFLSIAGLFALTSVVKAQDIKMDGGLAVIEDKKIPNRQTPIFPAGAENARQFSQRCTACQLCVSVCPNHVLRPSNELSTLMQPHLSFERGYCRPECTKCSEVCPSRAIQRVTREEKSSIKIGSAVWIKDNCLVFANGIRCNNCARHCPTGAIQMVPVNGNDEKSLSFPSINNERCIGCGACEFVCPSRPFSAMFVNGVEVQRVI